MNQLNNFPFLNSLKKKLRNYLYAATTKPSRTNSNAAASSADPTLRNIAGALKQIEYSDEQSQFPHTTTVHAETSAMLHKLTQQLDPLSNDPPLSMLQTINALQSITGSVSDRPRDHRLQQRFSHTHFASNSTTPPQAAPKSELQRQSTLHMHTGDTAARS
jgi:hypothetical protein